MSDETVSINEEPARGPLRVDKRHLDLPYTLETGLASKVLLKIMTYNIGNGSDERFQTERLLAVVKLVKTNEADVVCLHDVTERQLKVFQDALDSSYLQFQVFVEEKNACGTLLMLRYSTVDIPDGSQPYYYDFTQGDGRIIGTEIIHLPTGYRFHLLTTRMEDGVDNDHVREAQYQVIDQVIKPLKNFVLVGDFNIYRINEAIQQQLDISRMTDFWYALGCPSLVKHTNVPTRQNRLRSARVYTCTTSKKITLVPECMCLLGMNNISDTVSVTPAHSYALLAIYSGVAPPRDA
jgi:endonuclease/exonuclease/phosphatase family metal-dependent hydrolase